MHGVATAAKGPLEVARVVSFLRSHYAIEAEVQPLSGENHNFLVRTAAGECVLKISAHGQTRGDLEIELAMVEHLAARGFSLELPRQINGRDGDPIQLFAQSLPARLMHRVLGQPLYELEASPSLWSDLGSRVAELTAALADFDPAVAPREHAWTVDRVAELQDEIGEIEDSERRRLLDDALGLYLAGAAPRLHALPRSWTHGDFNRGNLMAAGDRLVGLVDFGDVDRGPTVGELAIAVAYAMLDQQDPLATGAQVVAGYLAQRALNAAEREVLPHLIAARLVTSLCMSSRRRRQAPVRDNYFVTEASAWRLLGQLDSVLPAERRRILFDEEESAGPAVPTAELLKQRQRHIGPALSLSYEQPLHIVRGSGQYLWDSAGRPYLDLVNNVCHVGHCHPQVVAAGQRQMAQLNTNTRYLYDGLTAYAERLSATLPAPLEVCFFVTSGSEANELALRIARTHTGRRDLLVVEGAYHGHTSTLIDISPYKFLGRGGAGRAEPWVHVVPMPDGYRGPHKGSGQETGRAYGAAVGRVLSAAERPVAGLILESLLGCGGQIIPPPGYLETAYHHVRAAGGLCIADEVQVGFGRVGSEFWAFETQGVVPDIVVLGKPIGNGHPMAAVVTSREIADSFANGMEFFSTFGGNPVSCAIGLAVLDVIESEGLQERARVLGAHFLAGLERLMQRHEVIGAVRGLGLFLGVELVHDRVTLAPAAEVAAAVVERMKQRGVLLSIDGPLHNVLKIKPPLVLTRDDIDRTLRLLDQTLTEIEP